MIKNNGGVFGRNPTFNNVEVEGDLTVDGSIIGTVAAGGSNTQVQFNNAGVLDANAGLTYDSATEILRVRSHATRYFTIGASSGGGSEILGYGNRPLSINSVASTVDIGDVNRLVNSTFIQINDPSASLSINCPNGTITVDSPTVTLTGTTASTSSTTGAIIIAGGVGIAKDSFINGHRIGQGLLASQTNLAVGETTLAATIAGGTFNTAIGSGCGSALTTGDKTTLLGYQVGRALTTGSGNCSVGYVSLDTCTVGNFNTAMGYASLQYATGSNNTAVGIAALQNITGSLNTALGREAGCFQADGTTALTTANNSVYLGRDTRGTQTDSNSVVIGYQAIGLGANTTVIGTSSTTQTKLFGQLTLDATACISAASATALALKTVVPAGTGVTPTIQVICPSAAFALQNVATTQAVFNTPVDTISLQAATTYMFEGQYLLQTGTTSHTTTISFVSSVAITPPSIAYTTIASAHSSPNASNNTQTTSFFTSIAGGIVASAATSPNMIISFKGIIRATDAGNLVPNILFSVAPGPAANFTLTSSYIRFYPIGANTIDSVGTAIT